MRDARITTIYEGTTAIEANDRVGRKLEALELDGGASMYSLIDVMRAGVAHSCGNDDTLISSMAVTMEQALVALSHATQWLLAAPRRESRAGAVAYLMRCGTVIGGWLMARAAMAATRDALKPSAHTEYLAAKRLTALH